MKILVACEESQTVTIAFRNKGHEAYSCDIQDCSGGHPEWHIKGDALTEAYSGRYDMMIAHPPCTYITVTANKWLKEQPKRKSGKLVGKERLEAKKSAEDFFIKLLKSPINKICIENPIGSINKLYNPSQIIHPYYFGDATTKATCLWIKNLPLLIHSKEDNLFSKKTHVDPNWHYTKTGKKYPKWSMIDAAKIKDLDERSKFRSKTFLGIANAMAEQWG